MPEVLYGRNPVLEALRAGRSLRRLLLLPGLEPDRRLEEVLRRADSAGVKAEVASRSQLNDVSHSLHHQGLAAYFDRRQLPNREALRLQVGAAAPGWPPLFICLDGVQDPQNLGALARSAEGLGASALVLSPHRNAPLSPAAVKASAGALEHLEVIRVSNLVQSLEELKQLGLTVLGLAPEGERAGHEVDLRGPLALVVGGEGGGLRRLTREHCDEVVAIPSGGRVGSLNAGVAAALMLYEVARQRAFHFPDPVAPVRAPD